ncbi:hypothetical protein DVA67_020260 [Solirubrobacter sp. CPCC 204708]|uniref:Uncharacterized protein n=1 Tax=Solirubrobacter deserti TaxID=2282478 RepID=A0ABT4RTM3_9ACTN|nr:hypothetical protein [Solirubrobacter deserti]MBE2318327.1 hypothetical protein [Solirubrobacter deserti]MDA0141926.1 hypothetical protein [Solirubrobacter deserti]
MTLRRRTLGVLIALGLTISACGGSGEPDRFSLTTPKGAAPEPQRAPVTDAERRVIRGWSAELQHGDVKAAAKYFSVPSEAVNLAPEPELLTTGDVVKLNDSFPCGAKLISGVERTVNQMLVADFEFVSRPGAECNDVGTRATFAFLIDADDHISRLILIVDENEPLPDDSIVA